VTKNEDQSGAKIGLETHVQLNTKSKLFCGCPNQPGGEPNTNVCDQCLGMPGSKPQLNKKAVNIALKTAIALDCDINDQTFFSRKTYFYPDLAKNFQITQYEIPIGESGRFLFSLAEEEKEVGIKRLHLEEDPAKLVHPHGLSNSSQTLVDYNRSGTPLIEIVTEPDLKSPTEARKFLQNLVLLLEYLKVYDSDSEFTLRTDANISFRGSNRVEVKNITGTKDVETALSYELERLKKRVKADKEIKQETRLYDQEKSITASLRSKESEEDYGYIFEPDLTKINLGQRLDQFEQLPELPYLKKQRLKQEYQLGQELVNSLATELELVTAFEEIVEDLKDGDTEVKPDQIANFLVGPVKKTLGYNDLKFESSGLETDWLSYLIEEINCDNISERAGELVLRKIVEEPRHPQQVSAEEGYEKAGGSELRDSVKRVLDDNQQAVEDYEAGEKSAINFLVGQVMQKLGGKADAKEARELLLDELEGKGS